MTTGDWIGAGADVVQVAVLLLGALWAYYKFIRGRTFHRRAELKTSASLLDGASAVRAQSSMKNTGGSMIPLRAKILRLSAFVSGDVTDKNRPKWNEIATAPVFKDHDWIESQETIEDDVLIPLADVPARTVALRLTCVVYEDKKKRWFRRTRRTVTWTSHAVLPAEMVQATSEGSSR